MSSPPPGQWGPPPAGPPIGPGYGPPAWGPQQPPRPPRRGNGLKWVLGAAVLVVVVVVTVGATLLFTRGDSGGEPPTASSAPPTTSVVASDVTSANDNGPVEIITEDPSCSAWTQVGNTLSAREHNGWDTRDPSIPATEWNPQQKDQYQAVGSAMRDAADQTVPLAKVTPHRVMRELYEQFIAYTRAYADRVPNYVPGDNHLAGVSSNLAGALTWICSAISYGSAAARGPLVPSTSAPSTVAAPGDTANPQPFLRTPDSLCGEWSSAVSEFKAATTDWQRISPDTSASQWTPEERAINTAVVPVMRDYADELQALGRRSHNAVWEDLANLSAQYRRAFIQALTTYVPADNYLTSVSAQLAFAINDACLAAGS